MHRLFPLACCCLLLACAAPAFAAQHHAAVPGSGTEIATSYQINPAHTGSIDFAAGFSPPLKQIWSRDLVYYVGTNYPVIADGAVFVTASDFAFALDIAKGRNRWVAKDSGGHLAYDNGNLFVLHDDGLLKSVSLDNGKRKWSVQLPDQYQFNVPPMAVNGQIFVSGTGIGGTLYAVDEATGTVQWERAVHGGDSSSPAFGDGGIYVAYTCHHYKFDPGTGNVLWFKHGNETSGGGFTPVYFDKRVLIEDDDRCGGNVVAKSGNGKPVGSFVTDRQPVVFINSKGRVLVASTYLDGGGWALHCWALDSEKELWRYAADQTISTGPVVINGQLAVGSTFGAIFMVDENGKQIFTAQTPAAVNSLSAGLGTLVVISGNSIVSAYVPE